MSARYNFSFFFFFFPNFVFWSQGFHTELYPIIFLFFILRQCLSKLLNCLDWASTWDLWALLLGDCREAPTHTAEPQVLLTKKKQKIQEVLILSEICRSEHGIIGSQEQKLKAWNTGPGCRLFGVLRAHDGNHLNTNCYLSSYHLLTVDSWGEVLWWVLQN